jgi:hypothetical protein
MIALFRRFSRARFVPTGTICPAAKDFSLTAKTFLKGIESCHYSAQIHVLLAGVFGQFHLYVGQYLLTTYSTEQMYEIIHVVFVTNALASILLQYLIGRKVSAERFRLWTRGCVLAFVAGDQYDFA